MFFESAFKGNNSWWRYLVVFIAAFAASNTVGAIPLLIAIFINTAKDPGILDNGSENLADLSQFGIEPNLGLILMIIPFIIGLVTIFLLIKPLHGRKFVSVINGTGSIRWSRIFFSFFLWTLIMGGYLFLNLRFDADNFTINNVGRSLIGLVIIAILLMPFQTTFEEVLFRGYLMQGVGSASSSKWLPLIVSSVLFGLMHVINPEVKEFGFLVMMPQYITYGLLFGLITVIDDGIELAMGAHAANNVFLSVFLTQKASTLQTVAVFEQHEVYPWLDYLSLVVVGLVFIIILKLVYKWRFKGSFSLDR